MYTNIYSYQDKRYPFQIFIGGRGCGKTYSALLPVAKGERPNTLFMRRTLDELELLADEDGGEELGNPFKKINRNEGTNVGLSKIKKKFYGIYDREPDKDGELKPKGRPKGVATAMLAIAGARGFDFTDKDDIIYDEFIPELHVRRVRGEYDALMHSYETINRNREFEGMPPARMWLMSNSTDLSNPILSGLGIISDIERAIARGREDILFKDRCLAVHILKDNPEFSRKKKATAIARLTKGTKFYDSAYNNEFAYNDFTNVCYRKLTGYIPRAAFGRCNIYQKKGTREFYVSYAPCGIKPLNPDNSADEKLFARTTGIWLSEVYVRGNLYFESYELKAFLVPYLL